MLNVFFFLGIFLLLLFNQSIYLFGGDSAEYSTALSTFSIPHPPGYPLYSLLGNLITRIVPFGSIPWKASLLSSIPTLLTAFLIFLIIREITKHSGVAIVSSFFYIFLFPVWLYAEVPEVFALNNLLIAGITYCIISFNKTRSRTSPVFIYVLIGLSIAHHHTFILFIPAWYFLITRKLRKRFFTAGTKKNIVAMLFGVSFYLYAFIASKFNPPIDWENSQSFMGILRLFTRSSYGTFSSYTGVSPNIGNQIFDFFSLFIFIVQDFRILGTVFIILGLIYCIKKRDNISRFLMIALAAQFFFYFYSNFYLKSSLVIATFERFLIASYFILIFYFAFGLVFAFQFIEKKILMYLYNPLSKKISRLFIFLFMCMFILILFITNYGSIKTIKYTKDFENYAIDILNSLPKDSILYLAGDTPYFTTEYVHSVEKKRPDIKLIYVNLLLRDYYSEKIKRRYPDIYIPPIKLNKTVFYKQFLEKNSEKFPIFYELPDNEGFWQPYGLLWKYYDTPNHAKEDTQNLLQTNEKLWKGFHIPILAAKQKNILFLSHLQELYARSMNAYLMWLINNNEYDTAIKHIINNQSLLGKDNIIDMNAQLALKKKDCTELKNYQGVMSKKNMYELSLMQLEAIIKYYGICDQNNQGVYKYLRVYQKFKQ